MTNAYLGLVSRHGLESLVVETDHATPFLLRRARRRSFEGAHCCWAVLDDAAAHGIMRQVGSRRFENAFQRLRIEAMRFGTIASAGDDFGDEDPRDSPSVWTPP